jgi:hypothetical protein
MIKEHQRILEQRGAEHRGKLTHVAVAYFPRPSQQQSDVGVLWRDRRWCQQVKKKRMYQESGQERKGLIELGIPFSA